VRVNIVFLNLSWQVPAVSTTCAIFGIVKRRQLCHLPIAIFCFNFKQKLENNKMGTIPWCVFTFRTAEPMPSRHIWFRQGVIENEAIDNSHPTMLENSEIVVKQYYFVLFNWQL
jgi:hypothetical protein